MNEVISYGGGQGVAQGGERVSERQWTEGGGVHRAPLATDTQLRCNRCHRPMKGTDAWDGACKCGGLIEAVPAGECDA